MKSKHTQTLKFFLLESQLASLFEDLRKYQIYRVPISRTRTALLMFTKGQIKKPLEEETLIVSNMEVKISFPSGMVRKSSTNLDIDKEVLLSGFPRSFSEEQLKEEKKKRGKATFSKYKIIVLAYFLHPRFSCTFGNGYIVLCSVAVLEQAGELTVEEKVFMTNQTPSLVLQLSSLSSCDEFGSKLGAIDQKLDNFWSMFKRKAPSPAGRDSQYGSKNMPSQWLDSGFQRLCIVFGPQRSTISARGPDLGTNAADFYLWKGRLCGQRCFSLKQRLHPDMGIDVEGLLKGLKGEVIDERVKATVQSCKAQGDWSADKEQIREGQIGDENSRLTSHFHAEAEDKQRGTVGYQTQDEYNTVDSTIQIILEGIINNASWESRREDGKESSKEGKTEELREKGEEKTKKKKTLLERGDLIGEEERRLEQQGKVSPAQSSRLWAAEASYSKLLILKMNGPLECCSWHAFNKQDARKGPKSGPEPLLWLFSLRVKASKQRQRKEKVEKKTFYSSGINVCELGISFHNRTFGLLDFIPQSTAYHEEKKSIIGLIYVLSISNVLDSKGFLGSSIVIGRWLVPLQVETVAWFQQSGVGVIVPCSTCFTRATTAKFSNSYILVHYCRNLNWRINQTLHGKIFVAYTCELINVVPLRKKFCVMVLILSTQLLVHLITVTDINAKGKLKAYRNRKLLTVCCHEVLPREIEKVSRYYAQTLDIILRPYSKISWSAAGNLNTCKQNLINTLPEFTMPEVLGYLGKCVLSYVKVFSIHSLIKIWLRYVLWRKEALVHILGVQGKAKPTFEGPLFDAFATNMKRQRGSVQKFTKTRRITSEKHSSDHSRKKMKDLCNCQFLQASAMENIINSAEWENGDTVE
eukprot:bmy_07742T0